MAEPQERNLSKSQEELAQAAKERANANRQQPTLTTGDKVGNWLDILLLQ